MRKRPLAYKHAMSLPKFPVLVLCKPRQASDCREKLYIKNICSGSAGLRRIG